MPRILVTGAGGQIGSELVPALRERYGADNVLSTDIRTPGQDDVGAGPFQVLDATDARAVGAAAMRFEADCIYHLAAILSAVGERDPKLAYQVNMGGTVSVLEVARDQELSVFVPSSIAAFGPSTPADGTPQDTVQRPTTMYGVTKVSGELLCDYYHFRYGVDVRGLRYPGIVSYAAPPGGGTTDWAVDIFVHAARGEDYTCFLPPDAQLDMMYIPDALRATIELMEADASRLEHWNAFNVTAMQLAPRDLAEILAERVPGFEVHYDVDPVRADIAASWPDRIDDSAARREWGWAPRYDVEAMVDDMLANLRPPDPSAGDTT
ncbi:MAG TPA: NAD-dependent epimerase/dehydratase family protein [Longimicrobiales bacterium]|nr:NAD-dependent epimerase/dehydratase family protein [Longimicrobiales bacterium]